MGGASYTVGAQTLSSTTVAPDHVATTTLSNIVTVSGAAVLSSTGTLTLSKANPNGTIAEGGIGAGTLSLSLPSASAGGTTISSGTLAMTNSIAWKGSDTMDIDANAEDIRGIIHEVADHFRLNIVIPDNLRGNATVKLSNVSWRQVFQAALTPLGYAYVEDGNVIKIVGQAVNAGYLSYLIRNAPPFATPGKIISISSASAHIETRAAGIYSTFDGKVTVNGTNFKLACDHLEIVRSPSANDAKATAANPWDFESFVASGNVTLTYDDGREASGARVELLPGESKIRGVNISSTGFKYSSAGTNLTTKKFIEEDFIEVAGANGTTANAPTGSASWIIEEMSPMANPAKPGGPPGMDVDFTGQYVSVIVRYVASHFGKQAVIPDALNSQPATIKLFNATWQEIIQTVLGPAGYTYVEDGNVIKIVKLGAAPGPQTSDRDRPAGVTLTTNPKSLAGGTSMGSVTINGGALELGASNHVAGAVSLNGGTITGTGTLTAGSFSLQGAPASSSTHGAAQVSAKAHADPMDVDFQDKDIRDILRHVADLAEINVVIADTLQGKATVKLSNVTWRQVFQAVLAPAGYAFVEDGNAVRIVKLGSGTGPQTLNLDIPAGATVMLDPKVLETFTGTISLGKSAGTLVIASPNDSKAGASGAARVVYVTGHVKNAGPVPFSPENGLTLTQAIARAGGLDPLGDTRRVHLIRTLPNGSKETHTIDVKQLYAPNAKPSGDQRDWPLQPEDEVVVPEIYL